jgi:hypothetical protein
MNDPNDPITTDLVLADGVGIGRHGSPFTTKSIAVRRHSPASSAVTSLRTIRFLMTQDSTKNRRNGATWEASKACIGRFIFRDQAQDGAPWTPN